MTELRDLSPPFGPYDREHPSPVLFDSWARLSAKLNGTDADARFDLLDEAGIHELLWEAVNLYWVGVIAADLARGDHALGKKYGAICEEEIRRRREDGETTFVAAPQAQLGRAPRRQRARDADSPRDEESMPVPADVDVGSTAYFTPISEEDLPSLPFSGSAEAPGPVEMSPEDGIDQAGGTGYMNPDALMEAAAPFLMQAVAVMTPQRYAELVAESSAASPTARATIHVRFDIVDDSHRRRIDDEMKRYFEQNPSDRHLFEQWLAHYRGLR